MTRGHARQTGIVNNISKPRFWPTEEGKERSGRDARATGPGRKHKSVLAKLRYFPSTLGVPLGQIVTG